MFSVRNDSPSASETPVGESMTVSFGLCETRNVGRGGTGGTGDFVNDTGRVAPLPLPMNPSVRTRTETAQTHNFPRKLAISRGGDSD